MPSEQEHAALSDTIVHHMKLWAQLETMMSHVLCSTLNLQPESTRIAYVIYFSPEGFDARLKLVTRVIQRFLKENPRAKKIPWSNINKRLMRAKDTRNIVAHGAPTVLEGPFKKKKYLRQSPAPYDIRRIGEALSDRQMPGLSAQDIVSSNKRLLKLIADIETANETMAAFHGNKPCMWP